MAVWSPAQIEFELEDEQSAGTIATLLVSTPVGSLTAMAEIVVDGRTIRLLGAHVHSDVGPNTIGLANIRVGLRLHGTVRL